MIIKLNWIKITFHSYLKKNLEHPSKLIHKALHKYFEFINRQHFSFSESETELLYMSECTIASLCYFNMAVILIRNKKNLAVAVPSALTIQWRHFCRLLEKNPPSLSLLYALYRSFAVYMRLLAKGEIVVVIERITYKCIHQFASREHTITFRSQCDKLHSHQLNSKKFPLLNSPLSYREPCRDIRWALLYQLVLIRLLV